jgi:hypothetical protein
VSALVRLNPADLPPKIARRFKALYEAATRVADPDRGAFDATTAVMDERELEKMAEEIVSIYDWVCHARGPDNSVHDE